MVRFGLDERYVGQPAKAGVMVKTDLTIHVQFHYPLIEPGKVQSLRADEVKDRADKVSDESESAVDDAQGILVKTQNYTTAALVGKDPYPLISLQAAGNVEIITYWKLTPEQETVDTFPMDKLLDLKKAMEVLLMKKGFVITNFDESGR